MFFSVPRGENQSVLESDGTYINNSIGSSLAAVPWALLALSGVQYVGVGLQFIVCSF